MLAKAKTNQDLARFKNLSNAPQNIEKKDRWIDGKIDRRKKGISTYRQVDKQIID